jgi:putative FmdB family regulatory protein
MPIYDYRCKECGAEFEKIVRLSEADRTPLCPECSSPDTRKQITTFASPSSSSSTSSSSSSGCGSSSRFS